MEKKLIATIASQYIGIGNYQSDANTTAWAAIAQYFIPLCPERSDLPRHKGIGVYGANGVGKTLHWQIIRDIAEFFGTSIGVINAEKINVATTNTTTLSTAKAVYIDDIGWDKERKEWGNTIDPIAAIINNLSQTHEIDTDPSVARLVEPQYSFTLYYSTNLDTEGYPTVTERYGARIADRLKMLVTQLALKATDSYRGTTTITTKPNKAAIRNAIKKYCIEAHGLKNPDTDLLPHEAASIKKQVQTLREMYLTIKNSDTTIDATRGRDYQTFQAALSYCDSWTKNDQLPIKWEQTQNQFRKIAGEFQSLWNKKYKAPSAQQVEEAKQKYIAMADAMEKKNTLNRYRRATPPAR